MIPFGILLAIIRMLIATHTLELSVHPLAFYTAVAHVYMGVLLNSWWINRYKFRESYYYWFTKQPWQWQWFWTMNAVEIVCFLIDKKLVLFF